MKLRRVRVENVLSFLAPAELVLDGEISILIGPNGGGKTNLLDIVLNTLRRHLLTSWTLQEAPTAEILDRHQFVVNQEVGKRVFERHTSGAGGRQVIEVELEVTDQDAANISEIQKSAVALADYADKKRVGSPIRNAAQWDVACISPKQKFVFRIVNNSLEGTTDPAADLFRNYLGLFEAHDWLRHALGKASLSMPMLSLPVNRAAGGIATSVTLSAYSEHDQKQAVDAATSRSGGSIFQLAIARIAQQLRLLQESEEGGARAKLKSDPRLVSLSSVLRGLGYEWELVAINALRNQYDIRLDKQGSFFLASAASTGERELLTYIFAIYALNVRDALIVIDEPELHLHPKWQTILLNLFETLTKETNNQFLLATHSPVFISPASIQYISRVFSENQQSKIVKLNDSKLPEARHRFSIVNSQNNEKIFFSDKVILVEGISDRLFFEAVLRELKVTTTSTPTYEVVDVGGKNFFEAYRSLLDACHVRYAIVADLDYVCDLGGGKLRSLFTIDESKIRKAVLRSSSSRDSQSLMFQIDEAIRTKNFDSLSELWDYIKSRHRKLRTDLNNEEKEILADFIQDQAQRSVYILKQGALEEYLPTEYRAKGLDKLIRFLGKKNFWTDLSRPAQDELDLISKEIARI